MSVGGCGGAAAPSASTGGTDGSGGVRAAGAVTTGGSASSPAIDVGGSAGAATSALSDPCAAGPCDPHAICLSAATDHECQCVLPWYCDGTNCQRDGDENWSFETWAPGAPPVGFHVLPPENVVVAEEDGTAADGAHSASITWTTADNRDLLAGAYLPVIPGATYTAHWWVYDADAQARVRPWIGFYDPDFALTTTHYAGTYSKDATGWREYTDSNVAPTSGVSWVRSGLRLYDVGGSARGTVLVDGFDLTEQVAFQPTDGVLDVLPGKPSSPARLPAFRDDIRAALNDQGVLYLALPGFDATIDQRLAVWLDRPHDAATVEAPGSEPLILPAPTDHGVLLVLDYQGADRTCSWLVTSPGVPFKSAPASNCSAGAGSTLEGAVDLVVIAGLEKAASLPEECGFWLASPGTASPLPSEIAISNRSSLLIGRVPIAP
jgi:hypothetical protein